MKRATEPDADRPRKLSAPELDQRRTDVLGALKGLVVTPELDISDSLLTKAVGIYDSNRLAYLPWEECTPRDMDIIGMKKSEAWTRDPATGFLRGAEKEAESKADCHSDLLIDQALRRRGLAFAMADLIDWELHEQLRNDLMGTLSRQPPPGYARVSVGQIRRADETLFQIMARMVRAGIKRTAGKRPLDDLLVQAMGHRDYNLALQPLPGGAAKRSFEDFAPTGAQSGAGPSRKERKKEAKRQAEAAAQRQPAAQPAQQTGGGKGKGKGGKTKMPQGLRMPGFTSTDESGSPICFAFNLKGCQDAPPGGTCSKGRHICALASCRKPHGATANHQQ